MTPTTPTRAAPKRGQVVRADGRVRHRTTVYLSPDARRLVLQRALDEDADISDLISEAVLHLFRCPRRQKAAR